MQLTLLVCLRLHLAGETDNGRGEEATLGMQDSCRFPRRNSDVVSSLIQEKLWFFGGFRWEEGPGNLEVTGINSVDLWPDDPTQKFSIRVLLKNFSELRTIFCQDDFKWQIEEYHMIRDYWEFLNETKYIWVSKNRFYFLPSMMHLKQCFNAWASFPSISGMLRRRYLVITRKNSRIITFCNVHNLSNASKWINTTEVRLKVVTRWEKN